MHKNVFVPLGLKETYIAIQNDSANKNTASSYYKKNGLKKSKPYWDYTGAGNMFATPSDLDIWLKHFHSNTSKWNKRFKKLQTTARLNNGHVTNYGFGIQIDTIYDQKIIQHGGAVGGFRGLVCTFPNKKLNIIILSNFSSSQIQSKIKQISRIILEPLEHENHQNRTKQQLKAYPVSNKVLKLYEGFYWSKTEKIGRKLYLRNDTLRYVINEKKELSLIPSSKDKFTLSSSTLQIGVAFNQEKNQMILSPLNDIPGVFDKLTKEKIQKNEQFKNYIGNFFSPELKVNYTISRKNGYYYIYHNKFGQIKLNHKYQNIYTGSWPVNLLECY